MKFRYIEEIGHYLKTDNFVVFFSNKNCGLHHIKNMGELVLPDIRIPMEKIIIADQVHGINVKVADSSHCGAGFIRKPLAGYDAIITAESGIYPAVKTADCIPVLLFDNESGVAGVIHSGREGTRKNIVKSTIEMMKNRYNCKPDNMFAFVGPGIGKKNYEISEEIFRKFVKETKINQEFSKLDIRKVINNQLQNEGIREENLFILNIDTYNNESYYSYRRDQSTGRQISLIFKIDKK